MKSRYLKKIVCIITAFVLCVTPVMMPGASADYLDAKYNSPVPFIHIKGLMTSDVYLDVSDPDAGTAYPPDVNNILKNVGKIIPALFALGLTRNYDKFADTYIPALKAALEPWFLNEKGEPSDNSGAINPYPAKSQLKKNSMLWFDYDWRLDPVELASQLNDYINYVLDATGCSQVNLEGHSFGNVILMTYCGIYGTSKVRGALFNASAANGETFTAELCKGEFKLDADGVTEFLKGVFAHEKGESFLNGLFFVLNKIGFTPALCKLLNRIVDKTHDRFFSEFVYPLFGNWCSIWSMIPDEYFDECYDHVFNDVYKNDGIDHSAMIEKIEKYNTSIRNRKEDILNDINDSANLYVVARYGYCSVFATPSWRNASDLVIDVKYGSFGAETADYGSVLSDEQIKGVDAEYISPDKIINASTCMFPEQTWFIYDYMHMRSKPEDMFEKLLCYDGQATVDTFPEYPRFLKHIGDGIIVPNN